MRVTGRKYDSATSQLVVPGLDPGIHAFARHCKKDVDGRAQASGSDAVLQAAMPGHDGCDSARFDPREIQWQNYCQAKPQGGQQGCTGGAMTHSQPAPGIVGPFAGLDVPW